MNGLLIINKPAGITSRKVVDRAEHWFPAVRIGHAGTLDPLATGVLVLCLGTARRLVEYVQRMGKTYIAGIRLGAWSDTDDADGTIEPIAIPRVPTRDEVQDCLAGFVGKIEQVPPAHSAARVRGRRAHELARAGREVHLAPRQVRIDQIVLEDYSFPKLQITVHCGKGTYIRSLARDLGQRLGCGALVETLERTRIGLFALKDAVGIDATSETARMHLLPLKAAVADLPSVTLPPESLTRLRQGQRLPLPATAAYPMPAQPREVAVLDEGGELAAIAIWHPDGRVLMPQKVFQ